MNKETKRISVNDVIMEMFPDVNPHSNEKDIHLSYHDACIMMGKFAEQFRRERDEMERRIMNINGFNLDVSILIDQAIQCPAVITRKFALKTINNDKLVDVSFWISSGNNNPIDAYIELKKGLEKK